MSLTGLKDIDRLILDFIPDEELLSVSGVDRKTRYEVCDDQYLKKRLSKYPEIEKCNRVENENWKEFFARFVVYKTEMWNNFEYRYRGGDFVKQLRILRLYKGKDLLYDSAAKGELDLVKYAWIKTGGIFKDCLNWAVWSENLYIIKYLIEQGANINIDYDRDYGLSYASLRGNLEIVKYLVEHGSDIHAKDNEALKLATEEEHHDIINYLIAKGAKY